MTFFSGLPRGAGARRNLLLDFLVQEADTLTIRIGATLSVLISDQPPSSPHFYARCLSCRSLPNLAWLGDRHQICWLAYPVAWLPYTVYIHSVLICNATNTQKCESTLVQKCSLGTDTHFKWLIDILPEVRSKLFNGWITLSDKRYFMVSFKQPGDPR